MSSPSQMQMQIQNIIEIIKAGTPFVLFLCGLFTVQFIEGAKRKHAQKFSLRAVSNELEDEAIWLEQNIAKMSEALSMLQSIQNGEIPSALRSWKFIPRSINLIILEKNMESAYLANSRSKRSALKTILAQSAAIELYREKLHNIEWPTDQSASLVTATMNDLQKMKKHYIYTSCCMRHVMQYYADTPGVVWPTTDEEIIDHQLASMNLSLKYRDLQIKRTITIPVTK